MGRTGAGGPVGPALRRRAWWAWWAGPAPAGRTGAGGPDLRRRACPQPGTGPHSSPLEQCRKRLQKGKLQKGG